MEKLQALLDNCGEAVEYMVSGITHVCRDLPKRAPGSEGEREAAEQMAGVLKDECGCTDPMIETFKVHPEFFFAYFYFSMACGLLCAAGWFIHPLICIFFGVLGQLHFIIQFVLYKQLLNPLLPEKESVNVTAVRPCAGETKQRVFLNGHIDAAHEFPLNYRFGGVVFETPGVMAIIGGIYYIVLSIFRLCAAGTWTHTAGLWGLLFVPFFILLAFTFDRKRVVDGANDDLTGCYMSMTVLREMERLGIKLENTELGVILTGSEEAGIRGAKAWAEKHRDDYKDIPTYIICFDTIHDPRYLMVNRKDLNSTVKADTELCDAFMKAAEEAGVPCMDGLVPPLGGSTDSAAFSKGGFRSIGITGLNHVLEDYYHTRRDSYDNLDRTGLENCYRATVTQLDNMERKHG